MPDHPTSMMEARFICVESTLQILELGLSYSVFKDTDQVYSKITVFWSQNEPWFYLYIFQICCNTKMIIKYTQLIVVVLPDVGTFVVLLDVGTVTWAFIAQLKLFFRFLLWILTVFCSGGILHSIKYEISKSGHVV